MPEFSKKLIQWQVKHGRHGLPWQVSAIGSRDAYRVWLSEIMLQQTQVSAVIPYYEKFLQRFPNIASLAAAPQDEVMQYWAGLGYYARARNLHRAAQQVTEIHGGIFPADFEAIHALPGIGRSTAAAICAFAFGQRAAILDGNVKRVFARHFGVLGDVKSKPVVDQLWAIAESELPNNNIEATIGSYTQGLMDLGATLCVRSKPACLLCPVQQTCVAKRDGLTETLPGKSAKRDVPHREIQMLVVVNAGQVLLEKRPPTGVWGGLWSLPECAVDVDALETAQKRFAVKIKAGTKNAEKLATVEHGFTHFSLSIFPVKIHVSATQPRVMEAGLVWLSWKDIKEAALPAPVKKILLKLGAES